jgi:hypothetical protein
VGNRSEPDSGPRLRRLLEAVEPGLAHRPDWSWGDYLLAGGVRSWLTLPEDDLPLLSDLVARVEAQAEGGRELGLPLSSSTTFELVYVGPAGEL